MTISTRKLVKVSLIESVVNRPDISSEQKLNMINNNIHQPLKRKPKFVHWGFFIMVRPQKEVINNSLQKLTNAYTEIQAVQELLKEGGLACFCSVFARINDDIATQAKYLKELIS